MWKTPPPKEKKPTFYSPAPDLILLNRLVGRGTEPETPLKANLSRTTREQQIPKQAQDRSDTIIICVQHILETTASMFNTFLQLGLSPNNIYLMGKLYSTCRN